MLTKTDKNIQYSFLLRSKHLHIKHSTLHRETAVMFCGAAKTVLRLIQPLNAEGSTRSSAALNGTQSLAVLLIPQFAEEIIDVGNLDAIVRGASDAVERHNHLSDLRMLVREGTQSL